MNSIEIFALLRCYAAFIGS